MDDVTNAAAEPTEAPVTDATEQEPDQADTAKNLKIARKFFTEMDLGVKERDKYHATWQANIEARMGRIGATNDTPGVTSDGDQQQTELNPDWSLTKTKTANLYSQVPTVQGTHENKQYAAAVAPFMKSVNYELGDKRTKIAVAMDEMLNDIVNASGVGALMVGYAARFVDKEVPAHDLTGVPPEVVAQLKASGQLPMAKVPQITDQRFFATRISPKNLLWPKQFVGSDFDDAPWIGFSGEKSWSEAKSEWKLTDDQKEKVVTGSKESTTTSLRVSSGVSGADAAGPVTEDIVAYDEIYYWRYRVDPDEPHFCAIWKLVRVDGLDTPVIHEAWKGQKLTDDGYYVGAKKFPVRVGTLTYITDNPIPPSDTEAGKPQVQDLRRSRSQMFMNRKFSQPMRWYDVNRLDPLVQEQLMNGTFQGIIPVNGDGSRSLGELARASYPSEDLTFDRNTRSDLQEIWGLGPNQGGALSQGDHTKGEVVTTQQNFATVNGQSRNRIARLFLGAVEVLAGWMCLYSDFPTLTQEERQAMDQAWDRGRILHDLVLKVLPDSTIVLDVNQELDRVFKFINMTAKSGYVNVKPLIIKAAELSGIDPTEVIVDPQPPKPDDPNISYRFTGKDDMTNPMVLGILQKRGELPSIDELKAVIDLQKQMLQLAQAPLPAPNPQGPDGVPPPTPAGPAGPLPPHVPQPGEEPAHPNWQLTPTIAKRQRDI
jgi:hypothetical protein